MERSGWLIYVHQFRMGFITAYKHDKVGEKLGHSLFIIPNILKTDIFPLFYTMTLEPKCHKNTFKFVFLLNSIFEFSLYEWYFF